MFSLFCCFSHTDDSAVFWDLLLPSSVLATLWCPKWLNINWFVIWLTYYFLVLIIFSFFLCTLYLLHCFSHSSFIQMVDHLLLIHHQQLVPLVRVIQLFHLQFSGTTHRTSTMHSQLTSTVHCLVLGWKWEPLPTTWGMYSFHYWRRRWQR